MRKKRLELREKRLDREAQEANERLASSIYREFFTGVWQKPIPIKILMELYGMVQDARNGNWTKAHTMKVLELRSYGLSCCGAIKWTFNAPALGGEHAETQRTGYEPCLGTDWEAFSVSVDEQGADDLDLDEVTEFKIEYLDQMLEWLRSRTYRPYRINRSERNERQAY